MLDNKFNNISVSIVTAISKSQAIVTTFSSSEDGIDIHPDIPKDLIQYLDKSDFSIFYSGVYYSFVHLSKNSKKVEDAIGNAISKLPSNITDICVISDLIDVKKLVSSIVVKNSVPWSAKTNTTAVTPKNISLLFNDSSDIGAFEKDLSFGVALAEAILLKKKLIDMPSNYLTPTVLVEEGKRVAGLSNKTKVSVVSGKELEEKGYGSLYAVSKGSVEEGHLLTIEYNGGKEGDAPIVLVGKGLTFDSGGISIKPSKGMGRMKGDMGGAATVLGTLLYAIRTNSKKNVVAIIATCENMPDAGALKPGDVITAKNGKTIEVEDTDAEGRLVLADALCHAQTFNGALTVDFATLTGAVISAIGHVHSGLFTEDDELSALFIEAGIESGDTVWRLPLSDDYKHFLDSDVADLNNLCLGQGAGATNGAVFLREFAPKEKWVHLDIAGTSDHNGSTGRPIGLMSTLLDKE